MTYHGAQVDNIRRDPFEQAVGETQRDRACPWAARLLVPSTAYIYDWNILPDGPAVVAEGT